MTKIRFDTPGFLIVVRFCKNPEHVRTIFDSLLVLVDELTKYQGSVLFLNDSPDDPEIKKELNWCLQNKGELRISIYENPQNLGFVLTVNRAFDIARQGHKGVLLLNSDTRITPGLITELVEAANSDPMIGFVSPRYNHGANRDTFSEPSNSSSKILTRAEAFQRFSETSRLMPRLAYVPAIFEGYCLFIKWAIIAEFGGLDPVGHSHDVQNDLIMRANRCGYRAVLANHAFVTYTGEPSFNRNKSKEVLNTRYPEYSQLISEYFNSPEYLAEGLLETLCKDSSKQITIGFDFSGFEAYHNGTFEAGKNLLFSAAKCWGMDIKIVVYMSEQAWNFHEINNNTRVMRVDPANEAHLCAAVVLFGQPFSSSLLLQLFSRAPVVSVFMLDTIASDCGNLRIGFDQNIWRFVMKWSDTVFTISQFTTAQIQRRYSIGRNTIIRSVLLSVSPEEYYQGKKAVVSTQCKGALLVIGNQYAHKAVEQTVRSLASHLDNRKIIALGCSSLDLANVECIPNGTLTDAELDDIYARVDVVVFPSHYEGFGFPVLHAMARSKPIFVRNLPVFHEIKEKFVVGAQNIYYFESTEELATSLAQNIPVWQGGVAVGEKNGWDRAAGEVIESLQLRLLQVDYGFVVERLRWLHAAYKPPHFLCNTDASETRASAALAAKFVSSRIESFLTKIFAINLINTILKKAWPAIKWVRGKWASS